MASEVGVYDTEPENILQKVTGSLSHTPCASQPASPVVGLIPLEQRVDLGDSAGGGRDGY